MLCCGKAPSRREPELTHRDSVTASGLGPGPPGTGELLKTATLRTATGSASAPKRTLYPSPVRPAGPEPEASILPRVLLSNAEEFRWRGLLTY